MKRLNKSANISIFVQIYKIWCRENLNFILKILFRLLQKNSDHFLCCKFLWRQRFITCGRDVLKDQYFDEKQITLLYSITQKFYNQFTDNGYIIKLLLNIFWYTFINELSHKRQARCWFAHCYMGITHRINIFFKSQHKLNLNLQNDTCRH